MSRVVVGMSGGVDSSVAAYLLKEQGHEVIGVTMQIWQEEAREFQEENGGCCGLSAVEDARRVAAKLDIPYYVMNFRQEFQTQVIDYFMEEYLQGRTPNPCIACNRHVKWEALLTRSLAIGADYIATGHYARVEQLPDGRYSIRRSAVPAKDQTYALYSLTQEQLRRTLMPVGDFSKEEIRRIAEKIGLGVAEKPDSQDICFVPDGDYAGFITRYTGEIPQEGDYLDDKGTVIGRHKGVLYYTIGQRRGLGIALGVKRTVSHLDPVSNTVTLSDDSAVYTDRLFADDLRMTDDSTPERPFPCTAKIRYAHRPASATVHPLGNGSVQVQFAQPQRAVTKGQAVVFYEGDRVLGGATIR